MHVRDLPRLFQQFLLVCLMTCTPAAEIVTGIEPAATLPNIAGLPWGENPLSRLQARPQAVWKVADPPPAPLHQAMTLSAQEGMPDFWTVQVAASTTNPVPRGSLLFVECWLRVAASGIEGGAGRVVLGLRRTGSPPTALLRERIVLAKDRGWIRQAFTAQASWDAAAGGLECYVQLEDRSDQTVEIADLRLVDLGTAVDPATVPTTAQPPQPLSPEEVKPWKTGWVTGARIDEREIRSTLNVDPAKRSSKTSFKTLRAGLVAAHAQLAQGLPTKLLIAPGIYREAVTDLDWTPFPVRDALLVIEAAPGGPVVWSGADPLPQNAWSDEGEGLWSCPVPAIRPPWDVMWGTPRPIGWQSELLFAGDQALRQEVLDVYEAKPRPRAKKQPVFTFQERRDPKVALKPGFFGVSSQGSPRLYLRLVPGQRPGADLEYGVRPTLVDFTGKHNLVLRGLTFTRCSSDAKERTVEFGEWRGGAVNHDVLVEDCRFVWNNFIGFSIGGERWTLRRNHASYNGGSGITSSRITNVVMEDNCTDFNGWRIFRGGEDGFSHGGIKFHESNGNVVRRHRAVGNIGGVGLWWDIQCGATLLEDSVLVHNQTNLQWEICQGPFVARRTVISLAASGDVNWWKTGTAIIEHSILVGAYGSHDDANAVLFATNGWRSDDHATRAPLIAGLQMLRDSVVVATGTNQAIHTRWSARPPPPGMDAFTYRGLRNVMWAPGHERVLWLSTHRYRNIGAGFTLAELAANGQESGSTWRDPGFNDIAQADFRFRPDSPLQGRTDLPQWAMSAELRQQMQTYFAWIGWTVSGGGQLDPWN